MISKWRWILTQLTRRLWARASLFALLGVAAALFGILGEHLVPEDLGGLIGARAVDGILNILASSMLAVTTFSLSVMVQAYGAATAHVTPRATQLLMQDSSTQNALAAFIGSFLFSLVGIVALATGAYGERGRVVLLAATLFVILLVVVTILRWIDHLSKLGRVSETTARVEQVTAKALGDRIERPFLGAQPLGDRQPPPEAQAAFPDRVGYVQHVDIAALGERAAELKGEVWVVSPPGSFVHPLRPLAWLVGGAADEAVGGKLREAFSVGDERSFDQDPRFGLSVLSEIASRALSPAMNDPGTAIDVIGRAVRLLSQWRETPGDDDATPCEGVRVPALLLDDLYDDIFAPIARDGAALVEVQIRLQKALAMLATLGGPAARAAALRHANLARQRAESALVLESDKVTLRDLYAALTASPEAAYDKP